MSRLHEVQGLLLLKSLQVAMKPAGCDTRNPSMLIDPSKRIIILGAGITGLTIARELSQRYGNRVVLLEKEPYLGGMAATFTVNSFSYDCGSHRLHPDTSQRIIRYIEDALGVPLLKRRRHGLLVYHGRLMQYPPKLLNLLMCFSGKEIAAFAAGFLKERILPSPGKGTDFESVMVRAAGRPFYNAFFKNYAKKLWGVEPQNMSADAKKKRTVFSGRMLFKSIFGGRHRYLYPRDGMGSIAAGIERNIRAHGAQIITSCRIRDIATDGSTVSSIAFMDQHSHLQTIEVAALISTIPIDEMHAMVCAHESNYQLPWRGVVMAHIALDRALPGSCETYYCPDIDSAIGRVSDIGKYSPFVNTAARGSLITVEIPATPGDDVWNLDESALVALCLQELVKLNVLPEYPRVRQAFFTRLEKVYPLYVVGWEDSFNRLYNNLNSIDNLYTIGRNGLFLHCNMDHCIEQGLTLAEHIHSNPCLNKALWHGHARKFLSLSARD